MERIMTRRIATGILSLSCLLLGGATARADSAASRVSARAPSLGTPASASTGTTALTYSTGCEPGSGGVIPCPCGNAPSGPGRGCDNFGSMTGGASLVAPGNSSLANDTVVLTASGENSTALTVFFQGSDPLNPTGAPLAAGVRCVTNMLKRLYTGSASAGAIARPAMGGIPVSQRSAQVGAPIFPGETRHYFTIYRDALAVGPCANPVSTVNVTNVASVVWL